MNTTTTNEPSQKPSAPIKRPRAPRRLWTNYAKPPGADETEEERRGNQELFKTLSEGVPEKYLPDWGWGPMAYMGDGIYICKSGYTYSDGSDSA